MTPFGTTNVAAGFRSDASDRPIINGVKASAAMAANADLLFISFLPSLHSLTRPNQFFHPLDLTNDYQILSGVAITLFQFVGHHAQPRVPGYALAV